MDAGRPFCCPVRYGSYGCEPYDPVEYWPVEYEPVGCCPV
jgi:hypothetical protein